MPADRRATRTVRVGLDARSYDVVIGAGLLSTLGQRAAAALGHDAQPPARPRPSRRALLAHDTGLPPAAAQTARDSLAAAGYTVADEPISATEESKSLAAAQRLFTTLAASRHERSDPVISLGGGVTGDLAGFAAAVYRRGVPVIGCPTTLLAMVDASIGGKTAVNLAVPADGDATRLHKNLVGAFHQPSLVICDVGLLATLPDLELRSGLAECIKHGLLAGDWSDPDLLEWTSASLDAILARDESYLIELVARNVKIKAAVVEADEREEGDGPGGGRLALNMGHTVAHAIETLHLPHLGRPLKHGEAVALGLIAEAAGGERIGVTTRGSADRIAGIFQSIGLPTTLSGLPPAAAILDAMLDDKKTTGGRLRLAIPTGDGRCRVVIDPPADALLAGIERVRARASL